MTRIETRNIADLKPAAYNPRKDLQPSDREYEALKNSISAFGFLEPIVWNERTGNVISGHQRLKVLTEQGVEKVPCVVVDFDEATERAANLAMNKIGGEFDFPKVADLLLELEADNFDLALTGFPEGEIKNIMGWTPGEGGPDVAAEYQGMPDIGDTTRAARSIHLHFETEADAQAFAALINQPITERTKALWYPAKQAGRQAQVFRAEE